MTAPADRCSTLARGLAEPLAGTAPLASTWVALEQEGPWGHRALTESHLDPELGAELTARQEGTGVTVVLIRRPGRHADPASGHRPAGSAGSAGLRTVLIAHAGAVPWMCRAELADPRELLDLDLEALGAGDPAGLSGLSGPAEPDRVRMLLVCTNSRRDECCALIGRPLAAALAEAHPGRVWEASHLGGHRLAPVVLSLPDGFVYGGPAAGTLALDACRGRSSLPRPGQAAELAGLAQLGATAPRALQVLPEPGAETRWVVADPRLAAPPARFAVHEDVLAPPRKESCRKGPASPLSYRAERIIP